MWIKNKDIMGNNNGSLWSSPLNIGLNSKKSLVLLKFGNYGKNKAKIYS